ncbi:MAG: N-acetylmuramoyl-L-alanine amidase, partial [Balneolaceae bacterium]
MAYESNSVKRMALRSLFRIFTVLVFVSSSIPASLSAQTQLKRISKAERSDGKGYVIRYHFTEAVDSFTVIQPAPDLVQMELFGNNIDTTGIKMPNQSGKI